VRNESIIPDSVRDMFKTITFGSLAFPFSEDFSEGLVEERPGVLRFYIFGPPIEVASANEEDADAFFLDSRCSSSDSFDDALPTPPQSQSPDKPCSPVSPSGRTEKPDAPRAKPRPFDMSPTYAQDYATAAQSAQPRHCRLCGADSHAHRRCPTRCALPRCRRRPVHAKGTCVYRKRVCTRCGGSGHGQERCTTTTFVDASQA
jgi:hypothetical protein